jgi:hypothetical protein
MPPPGKGARGKPPPAELIEKQLKALELRRAGVDFQTIATQLGYTDRGGAWRAVQSALKRGFVEPAADLRQLEAERLDRLQAAVWAAALRGDTKAIDRVLRISDQRARLLGLNAPTKTDVTVRLDEQQAVLLLRAIRGILADLHLTGEQQAIVGEVVPRHLRAIEAS